MKISKELMQTISKNLMIDITDEEVEKIYLTIKKSVEAIEKIKEFNFDHIEPMDFPNIVTSNNFREDEVVEFKNKDKLVESASDIKGKYIKI